MAVKVVSKPKHPPHQAKCHNCGAVCSYEKGDVQEYHGTDYGGGPDGQEWINCGSCRERIILKSW